MLAIKNPSLWRRVPAIRAAVLLMPLVLTPLCLLRAQDILGDEEDQDFEEAIDEAPTGITFYLPLDGDSVGRTPDLKVRSLARDYDEELPVEYTDGLVGKAALLYGCRHLLYPADVVLDRQKGSLFFWFRWRPDVKEPPQGATIVDGPLAFPDIRMLCTPDDKWHNWVVTWNAGKKRKTIYRDGEPVAQVKMAGPVTGPLVKFGWRCRGMLDELYLFDAPLSQDEIRRAIKRTGPDRASWPDAAELKPTDYRYPVTMGASKQKRPRLPRAVTWDLKPVGETATRHRYALSGHWRVQPLGTQVSRPALGAEGKARSTRVVSLAPKPGPWAFAKVPGSWRPTGPSFQGGILDSQRRPIGNWKDVAVSFYPAAWLERDFALEGLGPERGIFLLISGAYNACDLYVNDVPVGSIVPWQAKELDISRAVRPGGSNRIDIMAGRPYSPFKVQGRDGETTWLPSGLSMPPCLEVRKSKELSVREVIPMPSFREKKLGVEFWVNNPIKAKKQLLAACRIADTRSDKVIDLPASPFALSGEAQEKKVVNFEWADPILWFPDDPHLLDLTVSVREGEGLIDETFPVRFGFREVWVQGTDFRMNGVRFQLQGQCHSFPGRDLKSAENVIERLGLIGFRSSIGYFLGRDSMPQAATEATLRAADAKGFLFNFKLYGGGMTAQGDLRARRDYFKQFRPHPCVVAYTQARYGYHGPAHGSPISLGRAVDEKEKELPEYQKDQALVDLCHEMNPGCLVSYYQQGVVGDYRSYMQYQGYGTPIQTREEWPRYWAEQRPAPFFGAELDMCCSLYLAKWQKGRRSTVPLAAEHAARYFGDQAYAKETLETVKAIRASREREGEGELSPSRNAIDLKALVIERTTRAWRTYGISYLILDDTRITYRSDLTLSAADLAYQKNNARFLAYIGGQKDDFVRKDHAFYAGETVQKQIIMINGRFHPVDANVRWRLVKTGTGEEIKSVSETLRIEAGDTSKHPIEFSAPRVNAKTRCAIELQVQQEGETTEDRFAVEVFPKPPALNLGETRVVVADETGDTSEALRKAGLTVHTKVRLSGEEAAEAEQSLAGADLLVIGRKSFPTEAATVRMVFRAAENGLNIVCFEQVERELFGLKNDDPNTRHAFISAQDHPVVEGLSDEDVRNWRGASNILESYPDYRKGTKYGLLTHKSARGFFGQCEFAQWSSNGTVATFYLEKPQTGSFKTILSSGFDMLYSPLVELRPGKGKILLCQLDVTNRYGTDPVATLIVNRLLEYGAQKRVRQPATVAWWGSPYWEKALGELRAKRVELKSLKDLSGADVALIGIDACLPRQIAEKEGADEKAAKAAAPPKMDLLKPDQDPGGEDEDEFPKDGEGEAAQDGSATVPKEARERLRQLEAEKDAVHAFLERGGVLIVPYVPSAQYVKWLPLKMKIAERDFYRGDPRGIDVLSGLSASDLFFREVFKVPAISDLPDGSALQDCGVVGTVPCGKGKVVFCQFYPECFPAAWQRTKVLRLWSTILTNLNVGSERPDAETGSERSNLAKLFYSAPALDFNPDQHTSW